MSTSVKQLVKLSIALDVAYNAVANFNPDLYKSGGEKAFHRAQALKTEDKACRALAEALDKATPERIKELERKLPENVRYVLDGF